MAQPCCSSQHCRHIPAPVPVLPLIEADDATVPNRAALWQMRVQLLG